MANSIELAKKFVPIIDGVYKAESVTNGMDAATRPDFIAYNYRDRRNLSLRLMRGVYGVHEAGWTVRDPEVMKQLEKQGVTPIFEQFVP